jgi:hypothetical protein
MIVALITVNALLWLAMISIVRCMARTINKQAKRADDMTLALLYATKAIYPGVGEPERSVQVEYWRDKMERQIDVMNGKGWPVIPDNPGVGTAPQSTANPTQGGGENAK